MFLDGTMNHKALLIFLLSMGSALITSPETRRAYFQLIEQFPQLVRPSGNAANGEIEIVLDTRVMTQLEKETGRDIGVVASDHYYTWINDACRFPNGKFGVYGRVLWTQHFKQNLCGVAVLPILQNGKIALNCNFRHATRSWEVELARGGSEHNEMAEDAARRELLEETGLIANNLSLLGIIPGDSGMSGVLCHVFEAEIVDKQDSAQEDGEAVDQILELTIEEIQQAFNCRYYDCTIKGEPIYVNFRDPFLAYALMIYKQRHAESPLFQKLTGHQVWEKTLKFGQY